MMKMNLTKLNIDGNTNQTQITLNQDELINLTYNSRILTAVLAIRCSVMDTIAKPFTIKHAIGGEERVVDVLSMNNNKTIHINIADILLQHIKTSVLGTISVEGLSIDNVAKDECTLTIEYVQESEYSDNHVIMERSVGSCASVSIDVSSGEMMHTRSCISAESPSGNIELTQVYTDNFGETQKIYANGEVVTLPQYNCGKGCKLDIQRHIVKSQNADEFGNSKYYYIDAMGKVQDFVDKYYYKMPKESDVNKTTKTYLKKSDIQVSIDGKLTHTIAGTTYDVFLEQTTDSGLKIIDKMDSFTGVELLEQRSEEIAQLEEENKQLEQSLQSNTINIRDISSKIAQIRDTKKDIVAMYDSEDMMNKNLKSITARAKQIKDDINTHTTATKCSYDKDTGEVEDLEITIPNDITNDLPTGNYAKSSLVEFYSLSLQKEKIEQDLQSLDKQKKYYLLQGKSREEISAVFDTIMAKQELAESEIATYKNTFYMQYFTLQDSLKQTQLMTKEYEAKREKNNALLDMYRQSDIQLYIMDGENSVMGFAQSKDNAEVFVLTDIVDAHENLVHINYERGKLVSVASDDSEYFQLKYNNDDLVSEIISNSGKSVKFTYQGSELSSIVNSDGTATHYAFVQGRLEELQDADGIGVRIECDTHGRVISITDTNKYKEVSGATTASQAVAPFNTHCTTISYLSICDSIVHDYNYDINGHKVLDTAVSYQFDSLGRVVTTFRGELNDNHSNEIVDSLKTFDYSEKSMSFSVSPKPYSDPILTAADITPYVLNHDNPVVQFSVEDLELINTDYSPQHDFMLSAFATAQSAYVCGERNTLYAKPCYAFDCIHSCNDNCVTNRRFELGVIITYADGEAQGQHCSFNWMNSERQYLAFPISVSDQHGMVEDITIYAEYSNNLGICTIDNLRLTPADWEYREHNDDKLLTFVENSSTDSTMRYEYNDDKKIAKSIVSIDGKEYISSYEYDLKGQLLRHTEYDGTVKENVYNDKGQVTKSMVYSINAPTSKYIQESVFDDNGNVIATVDERGGYNREEYTYEHGSLTLSKDAKGQSVARGYNSQDEIVQISASADGQVNDTTYQYNLGYLTRLTHNDTHFDYAYDEQGSLKSVAIAGQTYMSSSQDIINRKQHVTYATGEGYTTTYDKKGNITDVEYTKDGITKPISNSIYHVITGDLLQSIDKTSDKLYTVYNTFDENGRVITTQSKTVDGVEAVISTEYDKHGNSTSNRVSLDGETIEYSYRYSNTPDMRLNAMDIDGDTQAISYDALGRIKHIDNAGKLSKALHYLQEGEHATQLVGKVDYYKRGIASGHTRYTYDKCGNIERVIENGRESVRYHYDQLNRLVREDNKTLGMTNVYEYDGGGNILQKSVYNYTNVENIDIYEPLKVYSYSYGDSGYKDQLLSYDRYPMQYDAIGNPVVYKGRHIEWGNCRQLLKYGDIAQYTYLANGVRRTKTVGGKTTTYTTVNGKLLSQNDGNIKLTYLYGADGIYGFKYDGEEYLYKKNIQGDITHILDRSGEVIGHYEYDAWGNHKVYMCYGDSHELIYDSATGASNTIDAMIERLGTYGEILPLVFGGTSEQSNIDRAKRSIVALINPIRYRGYYYDQETGLYYLQSRYYDSQVGRFINADSIEYLDPETIGGLNLYAYCGNNPVMAVDPSGNAWWNPFSWNWKAIGKGIASAAAVIVSVAAFAGLAVATAGTSLLLGAALMSVAVGIGVGAGIGGASALINGTDFAGGLLSGAIKGGAIGTAVGLGIMTGGGAFGVAGGVLALGGAVALNFGAGMASYAIDNSSNGRSLNWKDAFASGGMQALSGAFAFGTGALLGVTGFYNGPGITKMFSAKWLSNIAGGTFIKAIMYYPFNFTFNYLQKLFFSGGR